jgi:hypothetical protein
MRKLKLELDRLAVETFDVDPTARGAEGTVQGNINTTTQAPWTAPQPDTADANTCGAVTCKATCACTDNTCTMDSYYVTCPASWDEVTCGAATCQCQ